MYDLNVSVPNITAKKYSTDNRFLLLKNYLYELNETLAIALGEKSEYMVEQAVSDVKRNQKEAQAQTILLKKESLQKFRELREQIIRTAEEIEVSYSARLSATDASIRSDVEKTYLTKSEHGEYKSQVNTAIQQNAEDISLLAENTDRLTGDLDSFKETSRSELSVRSDAIISRLEKEYLNKDQAGELEERISSMITQTENTITENFSDDLYNISQDLSTVGGSVSELISELDVFIRRGELESGVYGIEIGRSDSPVRARFTNDRLSFYQGKSEVAYISGSSLYITNADVLDFLRIGNSLDGYFLFDTTSNGLEVRWIDGD